MRFFCNPSDLSEALGVVSRALPKNANIPVLEGIKVSAFQNEITLSATDLEMFIEKKIKANVLSEGETVVTGKFFVDFIRKLSNIDEIEISKEEEARITVKYLNNKSVVQCLNSETYPSINKVDDDVQFAVKQKDLKSALEKTIFAVSTEDSRPILKGCLLEIKKDFVNCVALDGYRFAMANAEITKQKGEKKIIINGKILGEISKILLDNENYIVINIQKNNILFDIEATKITTRLMEGDYIDYIKILPARFDADVVVNKADFVMCLERILLITKEQNQNFVKVTVRQNKLIISSSGAVGDIKEEISATTTGKEMEVAFNSRYLYDAFTRIEEDSAKICISGTNSPATIEPVTGVQYKYLVLPVRMMG